MKLTKPEVTFAGPALHTIQGPKNETDAFDNLTHRFDQSIAAYLADE